MNRNQKTPDSWITSNLGEQLIRSNERINPRDNPEQRFLLLGLEHIESVTGELLQVAAVPGREIRSTKNVFRAGDILYGRLRPYLNKVHLAKSDGICSTDIWVLKTTSTLDKEYATHYLRSAAVLERVSQRAVGANLPRIMAPDFDSVPIPVPPLPEQHRIVANLNKAEELRRLREEANSLSQELLPAFFREMFGDPATNPKGWRTDEFGELVSFVTSGSRGWAKYYSKQGAKFIRVQNLTGHRLSFEDIAFVSPPDTAEARRTRIKPNDLLISITGVTGLVAVASEDIGDAYISQHVAIVRLRDGIDPHFVAAFLAYPTGGQAQFERLQYGQTKPGLGLEDIRSISIIVPPIDLQCDYAQRAAQAQTIENMQTEATIRFDDLFQSLLNQAFTGELTSSWRERHAEELHDAAVQRDIVLSLRAERPRLADFETGRVTQEEQDVFQRQIAEQMAPAVSGLLDTLRAQLAPFADLSKQVAFASLAETIKPALPNYSDLVDQTLSQSLAALGRSALDGLAQQSQALAKVAQASLVDAAQQSMQDYQLALARQMAEIATQIRQEVLLAELPQSHRTVLRSLDKSSLTLLREAKARPAYFRPEDLIDGQMSVLEVEEKLHILEALGFVRQVQVRGHIRYRLVDHESEYAPKEEWAS